MDALPALRAAWEEAPEDFDVLINFGECVFQHGDMETAYAALLQAVRQRPDSARALNDIGVILEGMGQRPKAIEYFEKTLAIAPDYLRLFTSTSPPSCTKQTAPAGGARLARTG